MHIKMNYKLAPIELTEEMLKAGKDMHSWCLEQDIFTPEEISVKVYQAQIKATMIVSDKKVIDDLYAAFLREPVGPTLGAIGAAIQELQALYHQ